MAINPGVAEIQAKRRMLLDGLDANEGFEQGLHDSATDQYAGKCHFIYELLQNAGDAGATEVEFILSDDSLEFRHNGVRLFQLEDVNSITNYHQSTKKGRDYEAVGKFGMGFKSVFFYTESPEIHSGDYHFRIERMFYPATNGVSTDENLNGWTKFTFPFMHKNRSTDEIFAEVKRGLSEIRGETLLFLRKIRMIECLFEDGHHLHIERDEHDHVVRLRRVLDGQESSLFFLKFTKDVFLIGRKLEIGIAYSLVPKEARLSWVHEEQLIDHFSIRPMRGKVFVYFPAEKEISNLQFHINAPFATPMSRESLTENRDNELILSAIAQLTTESLAFLRDHRLLHTETLGVFPIDRDQLPRKYLIFKSTIVDAFNSQDLTPTKSGQYKRADQLIRSENRMSDLFSDSDMTRLYWQYRMPVWVKAPSQLHSREDEFLSSLDIRTFGNADLKRFVCGEIDGTNAGFYKLIESFDDRRLLGLYEKLADLPIEPKCSSWSGWSLGPIFRATDGRNYRGYDLYFDPGARTSDAVGNTKYLKKIYRESDASLIGFFKKHGVKECSAANVLQSQLKSTAECRVEPVAIDRHLNLVRLLLRAFGESSGSVSSFKNFRWLCTRNQNASDLMLALAENIIIDQPYENTGMRALCALYPNKYKLSDLYVQRLSPTELNTLNLVIAKFNFIRGIRESYTESSSAYAYGTHPRSYELAPPINARPRDPIFQDCVVEGLENLIRSINDNISLRLWNLLVSLRGSRSLKARYRCNASHVTETDSTLICRLQDFSWVKGIDDKWHQPSDITFETLHRMYAPRSMCEGLRAVQFGVRALKIQKANLEKREEIEKFIRSTGAANEDEIREAVELVHAAKECGIDVKEQILRKRVAAEMPEEAICNVDRRRQRVREDYLLSSDQTHEVRERSVRTSVSMEPQARERLQRDYTDDAREMRCQLCRLPMPFDKRDGQPYFECVQLFYGMKKESPDQYLALCPTCRAAFDEWIRKLDSNVNELRHSILMRQIRSGERFVVIELPCHGTPNCPVAPTKDKTLYFLAKHFVDLKTVLEEENL